MLELAKVWELKNKGFVEADKPIILIGGFWRPLLGAVATDDPDSGRHIRLVDGPRQAVELLGEY